MKTIRKLAGGLLVLTGVMHLISTAFTKFEMTSIITIVFGLAYLVIGFLLFKRGRVILWLAAIVPLVGLLLAAIGMLSNPTLLGAAFILIDIIVASCCFYIITRKG
jgi:hypothetical protein